MSKPALDSITPVTPPRVNKKIKANANSIEVLYCNLPPQRVAIQLNTLIPVGTAIIIVVDAKYALVSISIPTVYMWWPQTMNPRKPIEAIAQTIAW
jgi:hypothetical protein